MARFRRIAAVAGVAMLAGAMVGLPAQASTPEVFFGSAAGKALDLKVLDTEAAFGASQAAADSTGAATARGAGALLPLPDVDAPSTPVPAPSLPDLKTVGGSSADASKADPDIKSKKCASDEVTASLPEGVSDLVNIGVVCSAAEARKSGGPSAKGEASIAEVGLNAQFAIEQLSAVPLGSTGSTVLDTICSTITGLPEGVGDDQEDDVCAATDTLADVITEVLQTSQVLDAAVGKTTSSVTTDAGKVTSTATAAGATVEVLPLPELAGLTSDPLVTVAVSQASATAVYDRGTGEATASFDPALARVTLNPAVADKLSETTGVEVPREIVITSETLLGQGVTVPVVTVPTTDESVGGTVVSARQLACADDPSSICVTVGPLQVRIRVGNGRVVPNSDGSVKAEADGVSVQVTLDKSIVPGPAAAAVADVPENLASLAIAHAEAAAGGQAAKVTKSSDDGDNGSGPGNGDPELSRTLPPAELPRTGGTPWIPLVGATVLSLAVVGRRVAAKATR